MGLGICFIPRVKQDEAPVKSVTRLVAVMPVIEPLEKQTEPEVIPEVKKEPPAPLTPEQEEEAAALRAAEMSKMFSRYAAEHEGHLPSDLSALIAEGIMDRERAGKFLKGVVEYRGADLTTSDSPDLTVLRYRIPKRQDIEARVLLNGTMFYCDPAEPIPEDQVTEEEEIPAPE